jgi:TolB-like protein/class 3 adenylate cyclase/cytochrome c-type biogenesis protein CcmH/NrfG
MAEQVERKLTAILAADVAGYSRLMAADEEGTLATLKSHRRELIDPKIKEYRGRIIKTTGDGMLVEFVSVVDAVRCAVDVQRAMVVRNQEVSPDRPIAFRVGINIGDVIVDGDDIYGDGVNIAARLESIAEVGGICVSATVRDHVLDKLGFAFDDLGDQNVKNIPRPVRAFRVQVGGNESPHAAAGQAAARSEPRAPRLSIVVLPFTNIGGDPEQDYFVDGVTESLTTDLSRISGSFVIARNTAFTYKGKPIDVKKIGRELNVRYVLEGSVQRGSNRLRVNVQLIDAETGSHLWAERFDKPVGDLFDLQDEIVARLANALNAHLIAAEARWAEQAPHPDAIDLVFQGQASINKGPTPENLARAREFFERALALDPDNIDALVQLANEEILSGAALMSADKAARLASAETFAAKALSLAPESPLAHQAMGQIQIFSNRASEGVAELEQALALDRNLANAHGMLGFAKVTLGRSEETEAHVQQALRLSPRDPLSFSWALFAGIAKLYFGGAEEAVGWFRRSIELNRNYSLAHFLLACALAQLGRLDQARTVASAGLKLDPSFTIRRYLAAASSDNPIYVAARERGAEALRLVGVPEA